MKTSFRVAIKLSKSMHSDHPYYVGLYLYFWIAYTLFFPNSTLYVYSQLFFIFTYPLIALIHTHNKFEYIFTLKDYLHSQFLLRVKF
jgi:succinate-acetate transporter protein